MKEGSQSPKTVSKPIETKLFIDGHKLGRFEPTLETQLYKDARPRTIAPEKPP